MATGLLLDTDVLIDYLRGEAQAVAFIKRVRQRWRVSCATVAELYVGVREGHERQILDRFIDAMDVIDLSAAVAVQAGLWRRDFGPSHGTGLIDALIAATAHSSGSTLVTLNARHYPMLAGVRVPYRKPAAKTAKTVSKSG